MASKAYDYWMKSVKESPSKLGELFAIIDDDADSPYKNAVYQFCVSAINENGNAIEHIFRYKNRKWMKDILDDDKKSKHLKMLAVKTNPECIKFFSADESPEYATEAVRLNPQLWHFTSINHDIEVIKNGLTEENITYLTRKQAFALWKYATGFNQKMRLMLLIAGLRDYNEMIFAILLLIGATFLIIGLV